ncbi:MAG: 23S rRNA (pseudouridine(1915)-N(3))-methyltransferase RlmH [Clostridia bacterium]|nr:23S rRNA (pseudouridine(1915)-N(3))-methyltransferase RlmH [Clostridia bacterium]MBQ8369220.1 23S rRNA (pseudouridine(1915)-N(3))-methyltransferase RlmH [Clostridia bacterium]
MLKIKIIAMGKLTESYAKDAAAEFVKRMGKSYQVTVIEPKPENLPMNPTDGEIAKALEKEAEKILAEIPPRAAVCAMCVEGKQLSSEEFAAYLEKQASGGVSEVCFIIGSSHGLSEKVKQRAAMRLSVSKMTFPHELFRVMLLEQIYRAGEILNGSRYHK